MDKKKRLILAGIVFLFAAASVWLFLKNRQQNDSEPVTYPPVLGSKPVGKGSREVVMRIFENQGCADCHGFTRTGAFGLNRKGQALAEGFTGCSAMLETVQQALAIPEAEWSAQQMEVRDDFGRFGCAVCHQVGNRSITLTKIGMEAGDLLHKGCIDMCCPPEATPAPSQM